MKNEQKYQPSQDARRSLTSGAPAEPVAHCPNCGRSPADRRDECEDCPVHDAAAPTNSPEFEGIKTDAASPSTEQAGLDNTAKEALSNLSHIENHLEHSDAPTTIKNRALDVRLCIKELQAAVKASFGQARRVWHDAAAPTCPACQGNDKNMPCAYPSKGMQGCLRDERLSAGAAAPSDDQARWVLKQIADLNPKTSSIGTAIFMAREGLASAGAAAKTEQADALGPQRWSKEDEMMESWAASVGNLENGKPPAAAGAGSAQPAALNERTMFEAWAPGNVTSLVQGKYGIGYVHADTVSAWKAWQARAAIAPSRDAGQEEASTQKVPSIGDDPVFQDFIGALVNNEYENYLQFMGKFIAYIDGRTAGAAGEANNG